jgi:DNA-binding IclR family transcriptional regulator
VTVGSKYACEPQQRLMRLIQILAGHEMNGLAPGEVAKLNDCSASVVTRDLDNLRTFGWAEQLPETGRWRLGPDIVRIATRHMTALDRADRKLGELRSRYGALA